MHNLELISSTLCPYTQRVAIQLAEKGLEARRTYIDLAAKPDWFMQLSPQGKVPVLRVGDTAVFETSVICEYIEETAADRTPLWPPQALDRARVEDSVLRALLADPILAADLRETARSFRDVAGRIVRGEGVLGALLVGFLATKTVNPGGADGLLRHQLLHVQPVAALQRDAPGRGVRLRDVAVLFQPRQLVADGGGGDLQVVAVHQRAGADRRGGVDVLADDEAQDLGATTGEHARCLLLALSLREC